jgi:hypothetical protein
MNTIQIISLQINILTRITQKIILIKNIKAIIVQSKIILTKTIILFPKKNKILAKMKGKRIEN